MDNGTWLSASGTGSGLPVESDARLGAFAALMTQPEEHIELDRAALELARIEYPALDVDAYLARLDALAEEVRSRIAGLPAAAPEYAASGDQGLPDLPDVVQAMNHVLFEEAGLRGNSDDYADPCNSFINDVLDRGLGIPITLSVIYMEVARRIGLELYGVSFPGHFLVMSDYGDGVVVIDTFFGGITLSEDQMVGRIRHVLGEDLPAQHYLAQFLVPAGKRETVVRMLRNLKGAYVGAAQHEKAIPVLDRLLLLVPDEAEELRDRAELYRLIDCFRPALRDFERYLTMSPDAVDAELVRVHVVQLRRQVSRLN